MSKITNYLSVVVKDHHVAYVSVSMRELERLRIKFITDGALYKLVNTSDPDNCTADLTYVSDESEDCRFYRIMAADDAVRSIHKNK